MNHSSLSLLLSFLVLFGLGGCASTNPVATDSTNTLRSADPLEQARIEFLRDLNLLAPVRNGFPGIVEQPVSAADAWMCWISEYISLSDREEANRRLMERSVPYSGFQKVASNYILSLAGSNNVSETTRDDVIEQVEMGWLPFKRAILIPPIPEIGTSRRPEPEEDIGRAAAFEFYSYKKMQVSYYCGLALFATSYRQLTASGTLDQNGAVEAAMNRAIDEWFSRCEDVIEEEDSRESWSMRRILSNRSEFSRKWWRTP